MSYVKSAVRLAGAVCLAAMLSGCVVAPAWGPGYYYHPYYWHHPHYWGY